MITKITNKLYQPVIFFFLLPLVSLLPGSIFAIHYSKFNYISFIIFYIYIIVNQLIENILLRIPVNDFQLSKKLLLSLEIINLLFILFFSWRHSWTSALALILYTITIQLQFLFTYYNLEKTAAFIASFLKVILLNSLSFYIHTSFIHYRFFPYFLGLFFPYLVYELMRSDFKETRQSIMAMLIFSYLFTFILFWKNISYLSLLTLFAAPFVFNKTETFNRQNVITFFIVFSILYTVLLNLVL